MAIRKSIVGVREQPRLGPSRVLFAANGYESREQPGGPLSVLLDRLVTHTLDPQFEAFGNFMCGCRRSKYLSFDPTTQKRTYIDLGPMYPESPYAVRFWGNFQDVSHYFSVDTDDAEVIEVLHDAIRRNQQSASYAEARVTFLTKEARRKSLA